jgi:hypothetical protein
LIFFSFFSQVTAVKKRVSFADGLAPGDGSSCSDIEDDGASPISAVIAKKQKKILKKKNKKQKQDKDKENRVAEPTKVTTYFFKMRFL